MSETLPMVWLHTSGLLLFVGVTYQIVTGRRLRGSVSL